MFLISSCLSLVEKPRRIHVSLIYLEFAHFSKREVRLYDPETRISQMIVKIDLLFLDLESINFIYI